MRLGKVKSNTSHTLFSYFIIGLIRHGLSVASFWLIHLGLWVCKKNVVFFALDINFYCHHHTSCVCAHEPSVFVLLYLVAKCWSSLIGYRRSAYEIKNAILIFDHKIHNKQTTQLYRWHSSSFFSFILLTKKMQ